MINGSVLMKGYVVSNLIQAARRWAGVKVEYRSESQIWMIASNQSGKLFAIYLGISKIDTVIEIKKLMLAKQISQKQGWNLLEQISVPNEYKPLKEPKVFK